MATPNGTPVEQSVPVGTPALATLTAPSVQFSVTPIPSSPSVGTPASVPVSVLVPAPAGQPESSVVPVVPVAPVVSAAEAVVAQQEQVPISQMPSMAPSSALPGMPYGGPGNPVFDGQQSSMQSGPQQAFGQCDFAGRPAGHPCFGQQPPGFGQGFVQQPQGFGPGFGQGFVRQQTGFGQGFGQPSAFAPPFGGQTGNPFAGQTGNPFAGQTPFYVQPFSQSPCYPGGLKAVDETYACSICGSVGISSLCLTCGVFRMKREQGRGIPCQVPGTPRPGFPDPICTHQECMQKRAQEELVFKLQKRQDREKRLQEQEAREQELMKLPVFAPSQSQSGQADRLTLRPKKTLLQKRHVCIIVELPPVETCPYSGLITVSKFIPEDNFENEIKRIVMKRFSQEAVKIHAIEVTGIQEVYPSGSPRTLFIELRTYLDNVYSAIPAAGIIRGTGVNKHYPMFASILAFQVQNFATGVEIHFATGQPRFFMAGTMPLFVYEKVHCTNRGLPRRAMMVFHGIPDPVPGVNSVQE